MNAGKCLADLPSNDPLHRIPSKANKFGFLRFDRILGRLIGKDGSIHRAPLSQALPVIFTTIEKPREIVIRFEVNELNAMVGQIAAAMLGLSPEAGTDLKDGYESIAGKANEIP
jgi:hypothetical protein